MYEVDDDSSMSLNKLIDDMAVDRWLSPISRIYISMIKPDRLYRQEECGDLNMSNLKRKLYKISNSKDPEDVLSMLESGMRWESIYR